jgi:hypothetical protein
MVVVVNPARRAATVYRSRDDIALLTEGDGGHSHLPGATASIDARGPLLVGPALTMGDTLFASRPDDPDRGRPTSPQKRPPRSL